MPPFKLVATDLDGTLFGPDLEIASRVQAAFGRARRAGAEVVIATGRMFCSALPYARILEVTRPLITYQGAWIRDPESLESIWHRRLPPE
ncbi:MAG: HAD family phosphatase, partial [Candidatus Sericytochromatia bacterium]|nr:HAD family phosphatase [Candidatus Tanganyikabacteria bacterium]